MKGLLIVVLILGSWWWFWGRMDGAAKVIESQLQAVDKRDFATAYDYLSAKAKSDISFEEFKDRIQRHGPVMDRSKSQFWSRSFNNEAATISGTIESLDTKQTKARYVLVKEDDHWVIESFSFQ